MDPVSALTRLGGVARWPGLTALGVGRSSLLKACAGGSVLRPARGVFALPMNLDDPSARALLARGQLSCGDAAVAHGLALFAPAGDVHVRIPESSARATRPRRTVLHPWGRAGGDGVTPFEVTLRDCAHCLDVPIAVGVLDSALAAGRIAPGELTELARPWSAAARRVVRLTDPAAQSVLESVGRTVLSLAGVGSLQSQVFVQRVGWVDLVVDGWLVVELDGFDTHKRAFQEDRRRSVELSRRGFVVLRFTYADLAARREWFVESVRETLDRGRPPFLLSKLRDDFAGEYDDLPRR